LPRYSFAKKLQSQTVDGKKMHKTLSYIKVEHKMLMKLTPYLTLSEDDGESLRVSKMFAKSEKTARISF